MSTSSEKQITQKMKHVKSFFTLLLLILPAYVDALNIPFFVKSKTTTMKEFHRMKGTKHSPKSVVHLSSKSLSSDSNEENDEITAVKKQNLKLTKQFFSIAFPAFIQLAAEPLASLVDTAYLGRLGPEVLGGAGVAISAQYSVSKLYNDPLLRTSISLVASQDGKARGKSNTNSAIGEEEMEKAKKDLSIAVSSALLLALSVGVIQLIIYATLASRIINFMGVTHQSSMYNSAFSYLQMRAFGTPAATLWLVTNGVFRGLGDTRTPLVYALAFTAMNAILDPIFIFNFKFGASGAALGTLLSQYIALIPLLMALNKKVNIDILGQLSQLKKALRAYLEAGGYVLFRTLGKVLAYSVCAREAALLGSVAAAAYNLTFQLGFATTQICEAVAVAVQTLLAREIADDKSLTTSIRSKSVWHLINGSILVGGSVAVSLSLLTFLKRTSIVQGLTNNPAVQQASLAIFPAVLATQVLKGLAYPVNGILMGGLDWKFTMVAMWAANFICVGMLKFFGTSMSLNNIWWALAAFMGTQVATGILRVQSKTGVWRLLKRKHN